MNLKFVSSLIAMLVVLFSVDALAQTRRCPMCDSPSAGRLVSDLKLNTSSPTHSVPSQLNGSKLSIDEIRGSGSTTKGLETRGVKPQIGTRIRPQGVPLNWRINPTNTKGGVRYSNPSNGQENIRVMQGKPKSPFPNSQKPYVRYQIKSGAYLDKDGKVTSKKADGSHIPLKDFKVKKPNGS